MQKVRDLINDMLVNGTVFRANINRARYMFMEDPVSGPDNFLFLVNTLGKNGKGALKISHNSKESGDNAEIMGIVLLSSIVGATIFSISLYISRCVLYPLTG